LGILLKGPFKRKLQPHNTTFLWFIVPILGVMALSYLIIGYVSLSRINNPTTSSDIIIMSKKQAINKCIKTSTNVLTILKIRLTMHEMRPFNKLIIEACERDYEKIR
jgi:beta-lactamase regulating signal transducer with metallopeptidase domain